MRTDAKVKELLVGGRWNNRLVREVMMEDEANLVCGIPVSQTNAPDRRIWAFTKDGLYSVKSSYHLEWSRKARAEGSSSEAKLGKEVWTKFGS